ncbi:MAG TPA: FkbM family methyltransferase [Puia sp.]
MSLLKSIIRKAIISAGYSIQKNGVLSGDPASMAAALQRLRQWEIRPEIIIDLGAAQGTWTEKALMVWPDARYELVEPLAEQRNRLENLKSKHSGINYHLAVAGEASGEVFLNVAPDLDGSGVYGTQSGDNVRKVPVITIDEMVKGIEGNILIKFDTHGYEVPILKGTTEALKRTSALIIEVYGFPISPTCLLFQELSSYLDGLGFRLIDMVDIMRRPGDHAFWQADAVYLRKDNPVFQKNSYA